MFCLPWCGGRKKATEDTPGAVVEGYDIPTLPAQGRTGGETARSRSVKSVDAKEPTPTADAIELLEEGVPTGEGNGAATPKITITIPPCISHENIPALPQNTQSTQNAQITQTSQPPEAQGTHPKDKGAAVTVTRGTPSASPKAASPASSSASPVLPPLDLSGRDELANLRSSAKLSSENEGLLAPLSALPEDVNPIFPPHTNFHDEPVAPLSTVFEASDGEGGDDAKHGEDVKPFLERRVPAGIASTASLSAVRGYSLSATSSIELLGTVSGAKTPASVIDLTAESTGDEGTPRASKDEATEPAVEVAKPKSPVVGALQLEGVTEGIEVKIEKEEKAGQASGAGFAVAS